MRVGTFTMYSDFTRNQQNSINLLNNTNRQIYSGTKIEFAYQDTAVFANTLRLDQEEYTLSQNSQSADMARQFALNSDNTMNQMVTALTSFKTNLIKATSESNSTTDRRAIAQELMGLKQHLMDLANTSINGEYLFSGSSFTVKPIDSSGQYQGNSSSVKALIGSGVQLPFNIDGTSLFLGSDADYKRVVSTNVPKKNITLLYDQPPTDRYITVDDKIKDMTGNNGDGSKSYFYISGTQSDGTSFNQRIDMSINAPISDLLDKIKSAYKDTVDVTLNNHGQIEITDLHKGSSKLQFQMVGADNSTSLTKAVVGTGAAAGTSLSAGSTSITVANSSGIAAGTILNIEGIGQIQVTSVTASGTTPLNDVINFQPPLSTSVTPGSGDVNIKLVSSATQTTSAASASGTNTVTLGAVSPSMVAGAEVIIGGQTYTISSVAGTTLTLASNLQSAVAAGDAVSIVTPASSLSSLGGTGQQITEFTKSGMGQLNTGNTSAWNDSWDHSAFNFNIEFKNRSTGSVSQVQDLMSTSTGGYPTSITLNGNVHALTLGATSTMGDFVDQVQTALDSEFGTNQFSASLVNGKLLVKDKNITPTQPNLQSSKLVSMSLQAPANTFSALNGLSSDEVYFKKDGATLSSTVSQVVKSTNEYAKPTDTLLSVAGSNTLNGTSLTMNLTTINGAKQTVTMNFGAAGSTFTLDGGVTNYNIINAASPQVTTPGDQVTYQQFMDVVAMVVGDTLPATVTPAAPTAAQAADYNNAVIAASRRADVYLNDQGQLTIKDMTRSVTNANISMYDSSVNTNYSTTRQTSVTGVSINSNNAITVDDPYISFFDQLQSAIDAVTSGKTRASDDGDDPRNTGMQNAITAIDHVFDHLVRKHTDIGAVGNAFQLSVDRSAALKINVITVRSNVLDTDVGSAYLELNQRSINYQALLATANKINSLSLVNYMK